MAKQNKKKKGAPKKKQLQSNFPTKKETVEVKMVYFLMKKELQLVNLQKN